MVKTLQEKIDSLLSTGDKQEPAKVNVTYYLSKEVVEAFRDICQDKRIMSTIVESLIEDFVKQRIAHTLTTTKDVPQRQKKTGAKVGPRRVEGERVAKRRAGRKG